MEHLPSHCGVHHTSGGSTSLPFGEHLACGGAAFPGVGVGKWSVDWLPIHRRWSNSAKDVRAPVAGPIMVGIPVRDAVGVGLAGSLNAAKVVRICRLCARFWLWGGWCLRVR